jgi:hypothetical protein
MTPLFADIAQGNTGAADVLFLVAVILFAVSAALAWSARALWPVLCALGLACAALGLLVL